MNLAQMELPLHIGTILTYLEIQAPPQTNRDTVKIDEFFLSAPRSHTLDLIFVRTRDAQLRQVFEQGTSTSMTSHCLISACD